MDNKEWFRSAKFGMMVHWGLYSLLEGEWKGKRTPGLGEWIQNNLRIPNAEYHELVRAFHPILFDAEEWVRLAKEAGMQYVVVTSKHHDGFALFHSKNNAFNVCDATPFGRDVIAELAEACYKHGLKLGLYYSQDLDWSEPDGGGFTDKRDFWHPTNDWDFPDNDKKDYARCFENKIKPQVTEILKNYGELCLIWFDTPVTINEKQGRELYDLVKEYQPNCLINSRIGNGLGDYTSWGDNEFPEESMAGGLFETPATLNDTWGYKSFDQNWKSPEKVLELKKHLNDRGINYLLNVGPDPLGRIPVASQDILREVGRRLREGE